jgi:hypothetical protein
MAIRISRTTPVFRLNIASRERAVLAATNFCSCAQFLIIPPPTNYIALIGAHRSKKSPTRCAHTMLMSRICFHFLPPSLQIVVDESGNPEYKFWLQSNCLLAFE